MRDLLLFLVRWLFTALRPRVSLQLEVLALRHQLSVYQRTCQRPRITPADRVFWSYLARMWADWREHVVFVKPNTVIAWQRTRFRDHWRRLSQAGQPGRPPIAKEIRKLIRRLSRANPNWGSPRIVGELAKLGIDVAKSTVEKYRVRPRGGPSPTWRAFLDNHVKDLVSIDFFTVPTVRFQVLFVFLVLAHHRRRVVHFNVTANPSSQWTAQQIVEAFPFDTAPRYLLRDRDDVYGTKFRNRVRSFGIEAVVTGHAYRLRDQDSTQLVTASPDTRSNSRVLWVTSVASSASAWHAIHRSFAFGSIIFLLEALEICFANPTGRPLVVVF